MKKYILILMMLSCTVFTTTSCEKEDGDEMEEYAVIEESGTNPSTSSASKSIPVEELPSLITDYIAANYPTAVILEAEQEDDGEYEVTLDNGLEIKFDVDGNFLKEEMKDDEDGEGGDDDEIAIEDLPAVITNYIAANYPDATIIEAEREDDGEYEVTLDNGLEIKFDADGNFLEEEMEDDEDGEDGDDEIAIEDLPVVITDYIAANYPDATILEAEIEDDGEYEVTLDNGLEIKFDADGNFLEEEKEGK